MEVVVVISEVEMILESADTSFEKFINYNLTIDF